MSTEPKPQQRKPHRVALLLSTEDYGYLKVIVESEKDTLTNVIRRLIRSRYKHIVSPRPQALTLRLPQSSSNGDFNLNDTLNPSTKDLPK